MRIAAALTFAAAVPGRKALASRHVLLRKICAFIAITLWAGATFAQQPTTFGANLFAPSLAGREIDAERRALPITPFYKHLNRTRLPHQALWFEPSRQPTTRCRLGSRQPAFSTTHEPRTIRTRSLQAWSWFRPAIVLLNDWEGQLTACGFQLAQACYTGRV